METTIKEMSCTEYADMRGRQRNNVAYQAKLGNFKNLPGVTEIKRVGKVYVLVVDLGDVGS